MIFDQPWFHIPWEVQEQFPLQKKTEIQILQIFLTCYLKSSAPCIVSRLKSRYVSFPYEVSVYHLIASITIIDDSWKLEIGQRSIYIEDVTRWREDMNFIFEWQNNILRTSAASE